MHDATNQPAVTAPQAAIADEQLDQPTTLEDKLLDERDSQPDAASAWAAATTATGRALPDLDSWQHARQAEWDAEQARRSELLTNAKNSDAYAQLARCFPKWTRLAESLRYSAIKRLAENRPVNPNVPETWNSTEMAARAVLRRYGITKINVNRLMLQAVDRLLEAQERIDAEAGIDWAEVVTPVTALDEKLRVAHKALPIDLDDPMIWAYREEQRLAAGRRLGLDEQSADELSRWALANLAQFDADEVRCWRIGSPTWLGMAERDLGPVAEKVERPVGVFITPDTKGTNGWRLSPVLSLELIRLVNELGGKVDRSLTFAEVPVTGIDEFLERVNPQTLHDGPLDNMESASKMQQALSKALNGREIGLSPIEKKVDRWGRLTVHIGRFGYTRSELKAAHDMQVSEHSLRIGIKTGRVKEFPQRRVGATNSEGFITGSAAMELGEAVESAVERGLPLLLSTEAAGHLAGKVRVGRMKGRPGMVTITSSDGFSASTRRVLVEQVLSQLRDMKRDGQEVTLDAGARQVVRMALAAPLKDDPILLGRQQEVTPLMVVGSGANASQTGTGKTIMSGRAIYHRAATTPRWRGMLIADGRLLGQWRSELLEGAPARGLPPVAPNVKVLTLTESTSIAGQIRAFDRECGEDAGLVLVATSILDRYPSDLEVINYHLALVDEGQRYMNPTTEAHRSLKRVRFNAVADCWVLTATPKGKSAETLDILMGLALGDEAMIAERLNIREAGDLMNEINAHRVRVNCGPHLVRVTRQDMEQWMPDVRPAEPLAIDADGHLHDLLEAIRHGGREAYRRMLGVLKQIKEMDKDLNPQLYKEALAELSRAQGQVLGNVGVYVDASVDPESLLHSDAVLAKALVQQGLVQRAMKGGGDGLPTLRGVVCQAISNVIADEQVIVFAERVRCLRQLAETLRERYAIEAWTADGSLSEEEFDELKRRFVAGEFPVLCVSPVGSEGHNLQNASQILHLDLPWTERRLEQRVGRAARPGSKHSWVDTTIPYIRGAGMEHVVSVLAPRGAEHHQLLDSFEGVKASESTVANQLGAITGAVAESKDDAGYAGTAAKLRVAAAVFGH